MCVNHYVIFICPLSVCAIDCIEQTLPHCIRGVTIRYPDDTIRIAILGSRYDTYRDTFSKLRECRRLGKL